MICRQEEGELEEGEIENEISIIGNVEKKCKNDINYRNPSNIVDEKSVNSDIDNKGSNRKRIREEESNINFISKRPRKNLTKQVDIDFSGPIERLLLTRPYQSDNPNVVLNFNRWMSVPKNFHFFIEVKDLQKVLLNKSPFVSSKITPKKTIILLLETCSPVILSNSIESFPTLKTFSSIPLHIANLIQSKVKSTPSLSKLLLRIPRQILDFEDMTMDEIFNGHELIFHASHVHWKDSIVFQPNGVFFRISTNDQGKWKLDGDLLHLDWYTRKSQVFICEDGRGRSFTTETYAPDASNVESSLLDKLTLHLEKVIQLRNPLKSESSVLDEKIKKPVEYYTLSREELISHNYPISIEEEQNTLLQQLSRDHYVETLPCPLDHQILEENSILGVDCEMCETDIGSEITRVTLINKNHQVIYDSFVRPQSTIVNYHTAFSGISKETLEDVDTKLSDVQNILLSLIYKETILVGHSLMNDLRALRMLHLNVADTSILYPHPRGFPFKCGLKKLAEKYLNKSIQEGINGHDSKEDAISSLELFLLKVENGPEFGFPNFCESQDFESIFETITKKCSFYLVDEHEIKPWNRRIDNNILENIKNHYSSIVQTVKQVKDLKDLKNSLIQDQEEQKKNQNEDELIFIKIGQRSSDAIKLAIYEKDKWEKKQINEIEAIDTCISDLKKSLPSNSLIVVVPQDDIERYCHLKGLQQQSKWHEKDYQQVKWSDKHKSALDFAYHGAIESFILIDSTE